MHFASISDCYLEVSYSGKTRRVFVNKRDIMSYKTLEYAVRENIDSLRTTPVLSFLYKDGEEWITLSKRDDEVRFVVSTAEKKDGYAVIKLLASFESSPQVHTVALTERAHTQKPKRLNFSDGDENEQREYLYEYVSPLDRQVEA